MNKVNKQFISEIDQKLKEFDESHERSVSQKAEIKKYNRINELRDNFKEPHNKDQ